MSARIATPPWPPGRSGRPLIRCSTPRSGSAAARRSAFPKGFDAEQRPRPKRFIIGSLGRVPYDPPRAMAPRTGMDMKHAALLAMAPIAIAFAPAPAAAQDAPGDKVNIVDVFGEEPCPPST